MNEKFLRLRDEVLSELGLEPGEPPDSLPPVTVEGLDAVSLEDRQIRFYHLWERLKHFREYDLDAAETAVRDRLAGHVQLELTALHKPQEDRIGPPGSAGVPPAATW